MLIFNSPSNPAGTVYTEDEVRAIAKVCEEAEIFVLSDEIYEKLCYNGVKSFSIAACSEKMKELTITVNGVSKTYAMTGWRIGYLAAPKDVAKAIDSFQSHATSNACSIAQYAAIEALSSPESEIEGMVNVFAARRKKMLETIAKIDGLSAVEPDGAFYVMLAVNGIYGKRYAGKTSDGARRILRRGRLREAFLFALFGGYRGRVGTDRPFCGRARIKFSKTGNNRKAFRPGKTGNFGATKKFLRKNEKFSEKVLKLTRKLGRI